MIWKLETGNIDVDKDVIVKGCIREGAVVNVKGNLMVEMSIESSVVNVIGDVTVKKAVTHAREGILTATGTVRISHATEANIRCYDLFIDNEAHHCQLDTKNAIYMTSKRGQLIGGHAVAMNHIEMNAVGSESAPETFVGVGPLHSLEFGEMFKKMKLYDETVATINNIIGDDPGEECALQRSNKACWARLNDIRLRQGTLLIELRQKTKNFIKTFSGEAPEIKILKISYSKTSVGIDGTTLYLSKINSIPTRYWVENDSIQSATLNNSTVAIPGYRYSAEGTVSDKILATYEEDGLFLVDESDDETDAKQLIESLEIAKNFS